MKNLHLLNRWKLGNSASWILVACYYLNNKFCFNREKYRILQFLIILFLEDGTSFTFPTSSRSYFYSETAFLFILTLKNLLRIKSSTN